MEPDLISTKLPKSDLPQQAYLYLLDKNYQQAEVLYQQLLEAHPDIKEYGWYLGIALLLQGQEAEAQTTWMFTMLEGSPDQLEQWTTELVAVLETEALRQEELTDLSTAWLLRRHIQTISPDYLTNLLHLLSLAVRIDNFSSETLAELDIIPLLKSEVGKTIDRDLLLKTLKNLLNYAALEPEILNFAEACLQQMPEPVDFIYVLMNRAIEVAHNLMQPQVSVRYTQLCLQFYPDDLNAWGQLSDFYRNAGKFKEGIEAAQEYCIRARALPDQVYGAFVMLRALMKAGGHWQKVFDFFNHQDDLIQELVKTTEPLEQNSVFQLSTAMFFQPYIRDSLARNRHNQNAVMQRCQASVESYASDRVIRYREGIAARSINRDVTRPLRIGYLSYCLKRHSVGWLSRWLFQYHDREQFEIYGYFWNSPQGPKDELQAWFVDHVTEARMLGRDSNEIADRIFEDEIDILIDLDSITADVVCEVMMLKPAPIQVTWLGWDASGIPAVDYFIADPYVLPETAEAHYGEKIYRLPQTYIAVNGFEVGVPTLRRDDLEIPMDAVIYWTGQTSYKRHPDTVRSQMQIIKAVPNSYLLIKGITDETSIQQVFLQIAEEIGVEASRLKFLPDVISEAVHRANLTIADVVLDTYPYNGATTTLETLWLGIPLVTRVGEHFSSRNSYTMMVNAGISEGIAWSDTEYVEWGVRLGTDLALRQQVTWKLLKSRQTAPLWNAKQFTKEMEKAYQQMWIM